MVVFLSTAAYRVGPLNVFISRSCAMAMLQNVATCKRDFGQLAVKRSRWNDGVDLAGSSAPTLPKRVATVTPAFVTGSRESKSSGNNLLFTPFFTFHALFFYNNNKADKQSSGKCNIQGQGFFVSD